MIWWETTGGAEVEFFSVVSGAGTNTNVLVNDRADTRAIKALRAEWLEAFRAGADGKPRREGGRSARYMARRIAWHAMDHAWEIEDRSES